MDDWNTSEAPPSGSATSPTTSPDHSSRAADSDPGYTLICEEPPKAAWKIAIARAEEERAQVALFDAVASGVARNGEEQLAVDSTDRKNWRRGRLRDAIAVRELTQSIGDLFSEALSRYG